jgi:hypothetical protein
MTRNDASTHVDGRKALHSIQDVMGKGMLVFSTTVGLKGSGDDEDELWEDVDEEVEDDGDLDV